MCEFSEELISWLDHELPAQQAADVEQHVRVCDECRNRVEMYRQLSETIDAYCDLVLESNVKSRFGARVWRSAFAAAAVAAAAVLLSLPRPVERLRSLFALAPDGVPAIALKAPVVPAPALEKISTAPEKVARRIYDRHSPRHSAPLTTAPGRNTNWFPQEAPIYIAIPADALFPPGALPEGVGFVADVNLRPDGSAQRLRLQPQLVGFQTRGARP